MSLIIGVGVVPILFEEVFIFLVFKCSQLVQILVF